VSGNNLVVKTDKHEVQLPKTSFTVSEGKLLFGMTQEQLNAEAEKSLTASSAAIAAGATVKGASGTPVGQIDAVADGKVTIALSSGQKLQLSQDALRGNTDGTVTIGYTSEQLQDLVAKASTAQSGAAESSGQ
jgi:preprotein translocase subunit YajC